MYTGMSAHWDTGGKAVVSAVAASCCVWVRHLVEC